MIEKEILSFDLLSPLGIESVKIKSELWLHDISAIIEVQATDHVSAEHYILYPNVSSRMKYEHVDPAFWRKRIDLRYIEKQDHTIINISLISLNKHTNVSLESWWLYWIYDLRKYLESNTLLPVISSATIFEMKKEMIIHSIYKILLLLINVILMIVFITSSIDMFIGRILGVLVFTNVLSITYHLLKTYDKAIKRLNADASL